MFFQISLLLLLLAARAATVDSHVVIYTDSIDQQKHLWGRFKSDHSKAYDTAAEEKHRFETFLQTLKDVDHLNQEAISMGGNPVFGITMFSDLSQDEFKSMYLQSSPAPDVERLPTTNSSDIVNLRGLSNGPATLDLVDWTGIYTTAVKHQGKCGSSWAMAATAQIESDAIRTLGWDRNTPLSAAQLLECAYDRNGCDGGHSALGYIYAKEGITTDISYPYDLNYYGKSDPNNCQSQTCQASSSQNALKVVSYDVKSTEEDMAAYVQRTGPLTVSVDATSWTQHYTGGLMTLCKPGTYEMNHYVQLVGVDTAASPPYWKVRNSWGTNWGEGGFMRMQYGVNMCGLSDRPATYTNVQNSSSEFNASMWVWDQRKLGIPYIPPPSNPSVCVMVNEGSVATITCPSGTIMSNINFASYGTPTGSCGAFSKGWCDSGSSMSVVRGACLNKPSCTVAALNEVFGDPCGGTGKSLKIQATCDIIISFPYRVCDEVDESSVATITCPSGTIMSSINFASYGTPIGSCGAFSKGWCDSGSSMSKVREACLNKPSCSVAARSEVFGGDPCGGTPKRLKIQATCDDIIFPLTVCDEVDESSVATINCPSGTIMSSINFASYGTPLGSCGAFSKHWCDSGSSMSKVREACLNKPSCTVPARNEFFGDPCYGTGKNLKIQATCDIITSLQKTVCGEGVESSVATINCPSGTIMSSINFASYGTPIGSCGAFSKGWCDSSSSMSKVREACLNKPSCTVPALNEVFGDPCGGTFKNLKIQATCNRAPYGPSFSV